MEITMQIIKSLAIQSEKKIVLLVMDGLGGLPEWDGGKTELETAATPYLDKLAAESENGLHVPCGIGITPGSAPGHLSLFGYDPYKHSIGRGVVAALGIGFPMQPGDVAARLNFAAMDDRQKIVDRRAGRIPTEKCTELCELLKDISLGNLEVFVEPVKDYRAVVIFRGSGLFDKVTDTDPQVVGVESLDPQPMSSDSERTADAAREFIKQAQSILKGKKPANTVLMRGFAALSHIPSMKELYKLTPLALPVYPDYKGISRLAGMDVIEELIDLDDQMKALKENWSNYDFFYIHHKYTDSKGEDGNFSAKVAEIERVDSYIPQILELKPDVLLVTGDHSTPSLVKAHTGHPVPFLIMAEGIRPDSVVKFGERDCAAGLWEIIPGTTLIRLALSYSDKLKKYGA